MRILVFLLIFNLGLFGCSNDQLEKKVIINKTDLGLINAIKNDLARLHSLNVTPEVTGLKTIKGYTFVSFCFNNDNSGYYGLATASKKGPQWDIINSNYDKIDKTNKIMNVHRGFSPNTDGPSNKEQFIIEDGYINDNGVKKIKVFFSGGFSETQTISEGQRTFLFVREYNQNIKKIEAVDNKNKIIFSRTYP